MKPETYVGIVLLALFVAASVLAYEPFRQVVFMFGCFAVGWNIPNVSEFLVNYWRRYVSKKEAKA
jgi:hypothetical protein